MASERVWAVLMMIFGTTIIVLGVLRWVWADEYKPYQRASAKPKAVSKFVSLSDKEKIELLRSEAKKRGMHWHIFCRSYDDSFAGYVFPEGDWNIYIEENAKPYWHADGKTQGETALALYGAIQEEPNMQPQPKRVEKICPPELSDKSHEHRSTAAGVEAIDEQ